MKKLFLFLSIVALFAAPASAKEDSANIYMMPRLLPNKNMYDGYGAAHKLSEFKGKFVLFTFWSRYCMPCLREMDSLNEFQKKVKSDGVLVVLISPEGEWANTAEHDKMLQRYGGQNLLAFVDRKGEMKQEFGISTTPHVVLIDTANQEIGRIKGSANWDKPDIIEYIYKLKAESNAKINQKEPVMSVGKFSSEELAPPSP